MIIITGGAGFIGSALVWGLNQRGIPDILIVEEVDNNHESMRNLKHLKYRGFVNRKVFLKDLLAGKYSDIEAIIHMGGCSSTLEHNLDYLKEVNLDYSIALGEWCAKNNVYFSYASSAAVYGDGEMGFNDDMAMNNSLRPLNPYGQSKLDFDKWVIARGLDKVFHGYRFFNVYGPNEYHKGPMRSMVFFGYGQISTQKFMKLFKSYKPEYKDGEQTRDFVYIKDIVDIVIDFMQNRKPAGIYNVGTGQTATWNDLAQAIFNTLQIPTKIEYIEMPEKLQKQYQYHTVASIDKLRKAGWTRPFKTIFEGAEDYIKNYLSKDETLGA